MNWEECNRKKIVKKILPDKNLINSLIEASNNKIESAKRLKLDKITASSIISLSYDALRELLEATAIKKGFKLYNHECYCSFLKEILKNEKLSLDFDRVRKIRNSINYYAKSIT